jgi:5-methylcytosine-specific restriction endonuclease McrA
MGVIKDLSGQRFERLVVLDFAYIKNHKAWWNCKCDCGNTTTTAGTYLTGKKSRTRSCGCLLKEKNREVGKTVGVKNMRSYVDEVRKPEGESSRNHLFYLYGYKANKRGWDFDLTIEEFSVLTKGNCYYCGSEPSQIKRAKNSTVYIYNGIDRVDNSKGYILENCVPCCKQCNTAKNTHTVEEFYDWISKIHKHLDLS